MGTISEYQRSRLASEAVGTPGEDRSGQIIANSVGNFADAAAKRMQALDQVKVTNAFYELKAKDGMEKIKLRQQFRTNPEAFPDAYGSALNTSVDQIRATLPDRAQAKFDTLVNRYRGQVLPENQAWVFSTQNQLALNTVNELGVSFAESAQGWATPEEFSKEVGTFRQDFDAQLAPVLDVKIRDNVKDKYTKNAARVFLANQLDIRSGNVFQIRDRLENDKKFSDEIMGILGAKEFEAYKKKAVDQSKAMVSEDTYQMRRGFLTSDGAKGKIEKMFNDPSGLSLSQAEQDVMFLENAVEAAKTDPYIKEKPEQMQALELELANAKAMKEITARMNDGLVNSNPETVARLQELIVGATVGLKSQKELTAFRKEKAQAGDAAADKRLAFISPLLLSEDTAGLLSPLARFFTSDKVKTAPQNHSDMLERMMYAKSAVLAERQKGSIDNTTAYRLLQDVIAPLSEFAEYDRVKSGNSEFSGAYEIFDKFSKNMTLNFPTGMSEQEKTQARVKMRTDMLTTYFTEARRVRDISPDLNPNDRLRNLSKAIISRQARSLFPSAYRNLQKGEFINSNGWVAQFEGVNPETGQPVYATPKNLEASIKNA